jgi:enoyl-CoA hydratase/carnithine racemase
MQPTRPPGAIIVAKRSVNKWSVCSDTTPGKVSPLPQSGYAPELLANWNVDLTLRRAARYRAPSSGFSRCHSRMRARRACPGPDLDRQARKLLTFVDNRQDALAEYGESFALLEREGMRQQAERWLRIWDYRKPVIAQVHGYCLSGGLDLLATTDLAFAASGTRFGHAAARGVGIPILMGMLPLKIGAAKTKRILFTGDLIDADEALNWGLVEWLVEPQELDDRAIEYCQRAAMLPMDALSIHKQSVNCWSEIMSARVAALEMVDMDALYHTTPRLLRVQPADHGVRPEECAGMAGRPVQAAALTQAQIVAQPGAGRETARYLTPAGVGAPLRVAPQPRSVDRIIGLPGTFMTSSWKRAALSRLICSSTPTSTFRPGARTSWRRASDPRCGSPRPRAERNESGKPRLARNAGDVPADALAIADKVLRAALGVGFGTPSVWSARPALDQNPADLGAEPFSGNRIRSGSTGHQNDQPKLRHRGRFHGRDRTRRERPPRTATGWSGPRG